MHVQPISVQFLALREQCVWLQICYNTYRDLYESGAETQKLLSNSAPLFFQDLNTILIEYCVLLICKITDSVSSNGRENLSILNINHKLSAVNLLTSQITDASDAMLRYRNLIKKIRNHVVSHLDLKTNLNQVLVGEHDENEITLFFENLYTYIDAVGNAVGVGPLDFKSTSGSGDVLDLLRLLRSCKKFRL